MREYLIREAAVFECRDSQGGDGVGGVEYDGDHWHVCAVLPGGEVEG